MIFKIGEIKMGFFRITGETEKPMPNHCVECDKPTQETLCSECMDKDDDD